VEKLFELKNNGINMDISGKYIYIRNGKYLLKYDLVLLTEKNNVQVFKKDGKARSLFISNNNVYMRDFCNLYEIDCKSLEIKRTWKLGENLSSDICSAICNNNKVYACIRGGKIIVIDLKNGNIDDHQISDSSMWDIIINDNCVYVCCVNGELIELNIKDMKITKRKEIHKKNIYSLYIQKEILYSLSQDMSLVATNINNFETILAKKKVIFNMSKILGIYGRNLITSNPNRNEITIWDTYNFDIKHTINFPTGGLNSKGVIMNKNIIYGSNIDGIYKLNMKEYV